MLRNYAIKICFKTYFFSIPPKLTLDNSLSPSEILLNRTFSDNIGSTPVKS